MTKGCYKATFTLELFEDALTCPGISLSEVTVDGIESDNSLRTFVFRCFMLSQTSTFLNS